MLVLIQIWMVSLTVRENLDMQKKHQGILTHRVNYVRTQEENGLLKAKEVVSRKNKKQKTLPTPFSWNLASEIMKIHYCNPGLPVVFVMAALGNSIQAICAEKWENTNAGAYGWCPQLMFLVQKLESSIILSWDSKNSRGIVYIHHTSLRGLLKL